MASTTLYPALVDSTAAAFIASGDSSYCRLYFSLSKYSSSTAQIKSIHISVIKQTTGQSVVKRSNSVGRYRATGIIILNTTPTPVIGQDNLYYVDILNDDIQAGDDAGWIPGWIYKIQIRLSTVAYTEVIGQTAWLNVNASNFSEWSTYCTTKAISQPRIIVPIMKNFDSAVDINSSNTDKEYTLSITTLDFSGSYINDDITETLYSYNVKILNENGGLIEDSGEQYTNQYYTPNQFQYNFKTELTNGNNYIVKFHYTTLNKYEEELNFNIVINQVAIDSTDIRVITTDIISSIKDKDFVDNFNSLTYLETENEEGRIGLKLYLADAINYNGNLCIRRADSRDNYSTWIDIKIINCVNELINNLDIVFDYTIENGVWYRYGVQTINANGERGIINEISTPIIRDFEYSYLIGEGGKQLKLKYDNTMNSYIYNYLESKTDTIGGQYPYITRNGNVKYRTIPVNGLISFNMDDFELFTNDKELYTYDNVIKAYKDKRTSHDVEKETIYDYKREHDFREKVLEFLQDGKPKLFKSASEGNLIIRLMNVSTQPNQTLNRMIYSFTSTAHEIAEATMENYLKYGFYKIGNYLTSFSTYTTKLGQLDLDFSIGDNIIQKIWEKYDFSNQNMAGNRITLNKVHHLILNFTDKPIRVLNNAGEEVLGNNFNYNGNIFTVRAGYSRLYVFDENIEFTQGSNITVLGGIENIFDSNGNIINTVHITVDFLYDVEVEPYEEKQVEARTTKKGLGQIYATYSPGNDIYRDIYYKYYYEWNKEFRRLAEINWTCIEAIPGAVFQLKDATDENSGEDHDINWTGILNIENLGNIRDIKYLGMRKSDGTIDDTKNVDVIIDYLYYTVEGTYKEET